MTTETKTAWITIQLGVEAEIVGEYLAVHRHYRDEDIWVVTHVPTGYAFCWATSEADARAIAEAVLPAYDWSFTTPDGQPKGDDMKRLAKICVPLGGFRADGPTLGDVKPVPPAHHADGAQEEAGDERRAAITRNG